MFRGIIIRNVHELNRVLVNWIIVTFTPQEKIKLENDMRTERDLRNQIAYARESGVEEGLARGRARGREEGREEERSRLLAELRKQGIPEDVIARAVGATK